MGLNPSMETEDSRSLPIPAQGETSTPGGSHGGQTKKNGTVCGSKVVPEGGEGQEEGDLGEGG